MTYQYTGGQKFGYYSTDTADIYQWECKDVSTKHDYAKKVAVSASAVFTMLSFYFWSSFGLDGNSK